MSPLINKDAFDGWELVTLTLAVQHTTERAILVTLPGKLRKEWVPKFWLHDLPAGVKAGDEVTVRLSHGRAEEKGLV